MIQECHKLYWETDRPTFIDSLKQLLREKKAESEARGDTTVYIHLLFCMLCQVTASQTRAAIEEVFPEAVVTGMTETLFGSESYESMLRLNFTFMESAEVSILEYIGSPDLYREAGQELSRRIRRMHDVKAVALYCAGLSVDFHLFVRNLAQGNEDIPIFGATTGMFEFSADSDNRFSNFFTANEKNDTEQQYVIGRGMYRQGIVLAVFTGVDLHVQAEYVFGWKPLGKEMTITATHGDNCISRIDDIRPVEIYHRYLNVTPDENFVYNISEFPLAIKRNGCIIPRVPPRYDE
jgi:hypothetical protein